jgi:hypothetical protein
MVKKKLSVAAVLVVAAFLVVSAGPARTATTSSAGVIANGNAAQKDKCKPFDRPGRDKPGKDKPGKDDERRCPPSTSGGAARADYNGDGSSDLAIGAPGEAIGRSLVALAAATVVLSLGAADAATELGDFPHVSANAPTHDEASGELLDDRFAAITADVPEFGGLHVDESTKTLVVNITGRRPGIVADIRHALREHFPAEDLPSRIRLVDKPFTFVQLRNWKERARNLLTIDGVSLIDVDDSAGLLTIGVAEPGRDREIAEELAAQGIPPEGWRIEPVEPVTPDVTLSDRIRPALGGVRIAMDGGGSCTLGFAAIRAGVEGFLTNSHCTNTQGGVESTRFAQPSFAADNNNTLGVETVDPAFFSGGVCPSGKRCRYSDSAFARLTSLGAGTATATRSVVRNDANSVEWNGVSTYPVAGESSVVEGQSVHKVGKTTGHTFGEVSGVCVNLPVGNTNIVLLCQNMASYTSDGGDSGSPVFRLVNCTVNGKATGCAVAVGLHWGSGGAFSPIGQIQRSGELGLVFTCTSNEC